MGNLGIIPDYQNLKPAGLKMSPCLKRETIPDIINGNPVICE